MESVTSRIEEMKAAVSAGLVTERDGRAVASPASTQELATLVRSADATGVGIEIRGAGTKRGWPGSVSGDLLLETRALAGVREHSWQDLTATVGAGTIWSEMQQALAQHGQQVALDPLWPEQATVGGVIAANDSGVLRLKYGSLRDLVIGMTLVLADGTVARSGGKVVKNVAGYDLHKLMIGAYGTLAVVTEVTFRLHSISRCTQIWTLEATEADVCAAQMMKVLNSQLSVEAMQLRANANGYALDIQLACMDEVMRAQLGALDALAGVSGTLGLDVFSARQRIFETNGAVAKLTMLSSHIAKVSAAVVRLGGESVAQASGILLARVPGVADLDRLRELLPPEGSLTVLRAADGLGMRPPVGTSAALMQEIKRRFDPKGTLNPGVVVGR